MEKNLITISATVQAEKAKTWEYYTHPNHIVNWNFATSDWQCPSASNDLRVGGKYCARMEAKDGSFGFDFEATYTELQEGNSFVYVMPDDRKVHVSFENAESDTHVTIVFDAETENPVDMQRAGWQAILDNFKKYTEEN